MKKPIDKALPGYDVMLVLGAQVKADHTPSEALARRLALALSQYKERPVPIICCGARGPREPVAEGHFMRGWLIRHGVPAAHVIAETRSYDTLQNIRYAKEIMAILNLSRALVVTSDYHLRRSLAICRRYGVAARGVGSPSDRRYLIKNHARECLAWVKFYLRL